MTHGVAGINAGKTFVHAGAERRGAVGCAVRKPPFFATPLSASLNCNFSNFVALVISIQRRTIRVAQSPAFRIVVAPAQ